MTYKKDGKLKLQIFFLVLISFTITFLFIGCGNNIVISSTPTESQQPIDNDLILSISSDKQIYSLYEVIFITMSLRNNSDNPLIVNNLLLPGGSPRPVGVIYFTIHNPSGNMLTFKRIHDFLKPPAEYFIHLSPNESTSKRNAITKDYNFDQIGIYTISAEYNNIIDSPDGRTAWKGTLESNTITIEIVP